MPDGRIVGVLSDPRTYGEGVDDVVHVQTHISHVFLAGPFAYKLKKAVTFPFLDFRTLAARERYCREELRLNRRMAGPIYLDVVAITDDGARLTLGGAGRPVDWVVRMRRLPDQRALDALLERGLVDDALVGRIAERVAAFHATAPVAGGGGPTALVEAWRENLEGVRAMVGHHLAAEEFAVLEDFGETYVRRHDAILRARVDRGHVRDGHGDLRTDHVYVLDEALPAAAGAPAVPPGIYVVDCVEFSRAFRAIDVAADLSFLAMELESLGHARLARVLVDAYAEAAGDPVVPSLVPFHACQRAIVRGKVEGLTAVDAGIDAAVRAAAAGRSRRQFALAGRFAWRSGDPVVIACTGLSGSGKSAVAGLVGEATGFRVLSSDLLRKTMSPSGAERYGARARAAVYAQMHRLLERSLVARESVIVDATYLARHDRDRLARVVRGYGWRHVFLACEVEEAVVRERLHARDASVASDARFDTYLVQRNDRDLYGGDEAVLRLDTGRPLDAVRHDLLPRLWGWRQGRPAA